jgi:uncharacterized protein (DUF924 family)
MNSPMSNASLRYSDAPLEALAVVDFWQTAGASSWFVKDDAFDRRFRERFLRLHEAASCGALESWMTCAEGALALVLLLDQFPRNAFRGTPRMYATDAMARRVARIAVEADYDNDIPPELRLFLCLPFGHSENLDDQDRSVEMAHRLGERDFANATRHRDIVRRFGRFPHRNAILDRTMTADEQAYLDDGGYAG